MITERIQSELFFGVMQEMLDLKYYFQKASVLYKGKIRENFLELVEKADYNYVFHDFSEGNKKLGNMVNFSYLPAITCPAGVPCHKKCYDIKSLIYKCSIAYRLRHTINLLVDMDKHFADIEKKIRTVLVSKKACNNGLVRWHVGGDIINQNHFDHICNIANIFPEIKFLIFTKNKDIDFSKTPKNLFIKHSIWGKYGLISKGNKAFFIPKNSPVLSNVPVCRNSLDKTITCDKCQLCFTDTDIQFVEH